ncbi:putative phage repressor [Novosphingobium sp. KN65.2]|nr:putative phage repressor [Novosphingobium sp. KN65.2]
MTEKPKLRPEAANVFRRLDELGLKQRDLAAAIGIDENKISKIKSGERAIKAAEVLDAHKWFDEIESRTSVRVRSDTLPTVDVTHGDGPVQLRVLDLDLAMGDGSNIDDYAEEGTMDFDAGVLRRLTRTPADRLFVARGSGDSMFPTLVNGDMVLIDPLQRILNLQDRIWAISLFGAGGIKRLQPVGQGRVEVISDNPMRENRVVDAQDLQILGRVIWVGREV